MRRFAQRAVVAAGGMLTLIMSPIDDADVLAQAHAGGPECVVNAVDQCRQQADLARAPHLQISCQPARLGAFCSKRWVR